jgi:CHAT domain-containing protein
MEILTIFDNLVTSTYRKLLDDDALSAWKKEFKEICDRKNASLMMKENLNDTSMDKYLFEDEESAEAWRGEKPLGDYLELEQQRLDHYHVANGLWRVQLRELDIDGAEDALRKYIREAAPDEAVLRPESWGPVFAACELGDIELARKIYNRIPDRDFIRLNHHTFEIIKNTGAMTTQKRTQYSFGLNIRLSLTARSQNWTAGSDIVRHIENSFPKFFEKTADNSGELWKRLSMAGLIYENSDEPLKAFTCWLRASRLAEKERSFTSDVTARSGIFNSWMFGDMFTGLARLCFRADEMDLPLAALDQLSVNHFGAKSWKEHALLFVEQARGRSMFDALAKQSSESTAAEERLARAHKRRLRMALLAEPKLFAKEKEELEVVEAELEGYEDELDAFIDTYLSPASSVRPDDLYTAIGNEELVIEVDFSSLGSTIFAITSSGIEFAQRRSKTYEEIQRPVVRALKHLRDYPRQGEDIKTSKLKKDLDVILQEISAEIVMPVAHLIREKKHVIFITSVPLTAFPFSVLPFEHGEPLYLSAAVSQVPSLNTLLQLSKSRQGSKTAPKLPISVHTIANKALKFVAPEKGEKREVQAPLILGAIEAMVIAHMFDTWPEEGNSVSRSRFKSLMSGYDAKGHESPTNDGGKQEEETSKNTAAGPRVLHISSHGTYNALSPWMSYLSLKDKVRAVDMMSPSPSSSQHHIALVVFAACLSGMGHGTLGNDVLGFAHVVLEAGCAAYLGALWKVNDGASILLMCLFYRFMRDRPGLSVARLWQEAQKFLHGMDKENGRKLVVGLMDEMEMAEKKGHEPDLFVKKWRSQLEKLGGALESGILDFKHPFFVGAFVVVGFGGMGLR